MRLLLAAALAACAFAQKTGTVAGTIRDSVTKSGVAGVEVHLFDKDFESKETTTDSAGAFRLDRVPEGRYGLSLYREGYFAPLTEPMGRLEVAFADGAYAIERELTPLATLRGRILDPDGHPLPNAIVRVDGSREAKTDERGEFAVLNLMPGAVYLLGLPPGLPQDEALPKSGPEDQPERTIPTYFPSATSRAAAARVPLLAGDRNPGYEVRLQRERVHRLAGIVKDGAGRPVAKASVKIGVPTLSRSSVALDKGGISMRMGGPPPALYTIAAGDDGAFEFPSLPDGDWTVTASSPPIYDTATHRDVSSQGVERVTILGRDARVEVRVTEPFALPVVFENEVKGSNGEPVRIGLMLEPLDGQIPGMPKNQPDGSMRFEGVSAGRYGVLSLIPRGDLYVSSVVTGGSEVLGHFVEIGPGTPPLRVTLRTDAGSVRGVAPEGSTVVLLPPLAWEADVARSVTTAPGGLFEFHGLRPGSYTIAATAPVSLLDLDGAAMESLRTRGSSVRVEPGSTASANPSLVELRR